MGGGATEDLRLPACGAQPGQTTGGIAGAGSGPVQQTAGQGHAVGVFFRLLEAAQGGIAQVQVAHAGDARFASAVGRGKDDLVAGGSQGCGQLTKLAGEDVTHNQNAHVNSSAAGA